MVPETRGQSGDRLRTVLGRVGIRHLLHDAFLRLRLADGFSHSRSLAFMTSLVGIQALIAMVGLATVWHTGTVSSTIIALIHEMVPGPAGRTLTTAVVQAHVVANDHRYTALEFGVLGAAITGTTAMGQIERGFNRIYGVERDRPTVKKYGLALLFTVSVGTLLVISFVCLSLGRTIFQSGNFSDVWRIVRWPLGLLSIGAAATALLRWSPRRLQPTTPWLACGSFIAVLLWGVATISLGIFFWTSSSFGKAYGPLAGIVALLLWSFLSSVSLFYGAAVAAQLESIRAGEDETQDPVKVVESEPRRAVSAFQGGPA